MMKIIKNNRILSRFICTVIAVVTVFIALCGALTVSATTDAPYQGYYYDQWGDARPAPNGYLPSKSVDAAKIGVPNFGTVNDLASDTSGRFYLLDSDKSTIYQMDSELNHIKTITANKDGEKMDFSGSNGFTVSQNGGVLKIYIADTNHKRVLVIDENGNLLREIGRPETDLLSEDQVFIPIKVVITEDDSIFILCQQMYDGAIMLNSDGEFLGFFGSNKVEVSASLLSDYFWKNLLGEKLRAKFSNYVPREYTNMIIDRKGFVYTTTLVTADSSTQIRRLNWKSNNILSSESFGDVGNSWGTNKFIDIATMADGLFAALDTNRGRIFVYGEDGDCVTIFGGLGTQDGTFRTPVAIEAIGDAIYVYDQSTQRITKFSPTDYGKTLLGATRLFLQGDYEKSEPLWQEVLRQNNGYEKAYISIGRNLMEKEEYSKALSYFKAGGASSDYSDAFEQIRSVHMRKWFPLYSVIFVFIICAVLFALRDKGSYKSDNQSDPTTFRGKISYALFHPNKGIKRLVSGNMAMNIATPVILLISFLTLILQYQFTGFIFNKNEPGKMDIVAMFIGVIGIFAIVVVSNWLVITMADGKGKLLEIANVVSFALIPILGAELIKIALSNVLISGEAMFLTVISIIGYAWGAALLILGLTKIHQFTIMRNIVMLFLTVIAICIILVLIILCFSIEQQIEMFFTSVINETKLILGGS